MKTFNRSLFAAGLLACVMMMPAIQADETVEGATPLTYEQLQVELKNAKKVFDAKNSERKSKERDLRKAWEAGEGQSLIETAKEAEKIYRAKWSEISASDALVEYHQKVKELSAHRGELIINTLMADPDYAASMEKLKAMEEASVEMYQKSASYEQQRYQAERTARFYRTVRDDVQKEQYEAEAREFRRLHDEMKKKISSSRTEMYKLKINITEEKLKMIGYDLIEGYREADKAYGEARKIRDRAISEHADLQESKTAYEDTRRARDTAWKAILENDTEYMAMKSETDALYKVYKAHEKDLEEREEAM